MINKLLTMSTEDIKNGYSYNKDADTYTCNICSKEFQNGEVFEVNSRYFDALKMVKIHKEKDHAAMLETLTSNDKKYTGITDNQKELLMMIHSGLSDAEIARKTGVAPSTIRHQKFVFREKAKQAKLFLAIYELAFKEAKKSKYPANESDDIIDVHSGAKMVDDRYCITKTEEEKILSNMFASFSPLKLKTFSAKEKNKIVILKKISGQFENNRRYSEKELNEIIRDIYEDFATIRRYLIEYGFMERTNDCKEYWLT